MDCDESGPMRCPSCGQPDTRVIDSRGIREDYTIRRRRLCSHCGRRFTTFETTGSTNLTVIKSDDTRVPFDRMKIAAGLEKACYKRSISAQALEELISSVEAELGLTGDSEVPSSLIGELVMARLRKLDQVAYIRFASVYRRFEDVSDFEHEIRPMLSQDESG
jgi:transcriptional repressor NrdR